MSPEEIIPIQFVPDHSLVDDYLASLRDDPAQVAVSVSPGAIAPSEAPTALGGPEAIASGMAAAEFDETREADAAGGTFGIEPIQQAELSIDRGTETESPLPTVDAGIRDWPGLSTQDVQGGTEAPPQTREDVGPSNSLDTDTIQPPDRSSAIDWEPSPHDVLPQVDRGAARAGDDPGFGESAGLESLSLSNLPQDREMEPAQPAVGHGIAQDQQVVQGFGPSLQSGELDSINQQGTSGAGIAAGTSGAATADTSDLLKKAADDIEEIKTLLSNGVNTAEIIKQLLQALKPM